MLPPKYSCRSGFTLIEILVVVAIIGILAAILFPVFARARENSRRAACMSNLKQVALAFQQYLQENDNHYPPPPTLSGGVPVGGSSFGWAWTLKEHVKNEQVFQCPSVPTKVSWDNYWMNGELLSKNDADISRSANVILSGDGDDNQAPDYALGAKNSPSDCTPNINCLWTAWDANDDSTTRHLGGANYSFADGHVKFLKPNQVTLTDPPNGSNFTFQIN
jgi:prepilin-type N-terminal cleavage/methylation domain-containing protein/prepilin-type processing-associated H-X9-DG protein